MLYLVIQVAAALVVLLLTIQGSLPLLGPVVPVGLLLLAAAVVVVISTGMNYLLSPSTNIMRDIYQRFIKPDASQESMVALQKVFIVVLGLVAFLMIFLPTVMGWEISVLKYAYFAYTIYGVAITPAARACGSAQRLTSADPLSTLKAADGPGA